VKGKKQADSEELLLVRRPVGALIGAGLTAPNFSGRRTRCDHALPEEIPDREWTTQPARRSHPGTSLATDRAGVAHLLRTRHPGSLTAAPENSKKIRDIHQNHEAVFVNFVYFVDRFLLS
jgi:hypothetical protein